MLKLGLVGYPLSHSLSPKIHTVALKACNLQGDYSLFPIAPDDKKELQNLLNQILTKQIQGLNVTIPHKQNIIEFLDELTPTAKAIGAVNTIYLQEDKLIGDNTDAQGFSSDLKKFIENRESEIANNKSAIVLGAGGSARSVVYALLNDEWEVTISVRRIEQAQELTTSFPNYPLSIIHSSNLPTFNFQTRKLIVNTTPVGMTPNINESPLPENLSLPSNVFVYDLVYNPRETKLVKDARSQGLHATTGLGMLIEQAALSFEVWTGCNPPRDILWNSLEN
jgi:shikimate dehydrogenase